MMPGDSRPTLWVSITGCSSGETVPERRDDLARLGPKVLVVSTLANLLSAALAGVLM